MTVVLEQISLRLLASLNLFTLLWQCFTSNIVNFMFIQYVYDNHFIFLLTKSIAQL
jgi:hypothetical protein